MVVGLLGSAQTIKTGETRYDMERGKKKKFFMVIALLRSVKPIKIGEMWWTHKTGHENRGC